MPTILRFNGYNLKIYTLDHQPAHIHARKAESELIVLLGCAGEPVTVRERYNVSTAEEAALINFVVEQRLTLCQAWEVLHGS